ncbi:MAG: response regulator transcription factor [Ignavibacteriae bacterium]|nr:response regulator transcription factor [Ignavibacteriota bacterium]
MDASSDQKIRIALVEDNATLRKRFEEYFSLYERIELVASYASGEAALNSIKKMQPSRLPHIVLMDIELPNISGIETTQKLKEEFPDIEVMMLTVFEDQNKILQSIQAGASGYLLKDESPDSIVEALEECLRGGAPISQSLARKVLGMLRAPSAGSSAATMTSSANEDSFDLSDREIELLQGLVQGEVYTTLAAKFFISPHTVRTHIRNIYKKLQVHNRAHAVRIAIEKKLV